MPKMVAQRGVVAIIVLVTVAVVSLRVIPVLGHRPT